jgi:hypothetical protein
MIGATDDDDDDVAEDDANFEDEVNGLNGVVVPTCENNLAFFFVVISVVAIIAVVAVGMVVGDSDCFIIISLLLSLYREDCGNGDDGAGVGVGCADNDKHDGSSIISDMDDDLSESSGIQDGKVNKSIMVATGCSCDPSPLPTSPSLSVAVVVSIGVEVVVVVNPSLGWLV